MKDGYWRINEAGENLSHDWRSNTMDGSGREDATSVADDFAELISYAAGARGGGDWCPIGPVDIILLDGEPAGMGLDGEQLVHPERELARWRHDDFCPRRAIDAMDDDDVTTPEALGFRRVSTMVVL